MKATATANNQNATARTTKKKKQKTARSHKSDCEAYRMRNGRELNKARKIKKHLKRHPKCADAVKSLKKIGRAFPSLIKNFDLKRCAAPVTDSAVSKVMSQNRTSAWRRRKLMSIGAKGIKAFKGATKAFKGVTKATEAFGESLSDVDMA